MDLVLRDGIPGLTMQRLADDVGCSVGTVYSYFASKGVLVAELQRTAVERIVVSLQQVRDRSAAALDERRAGPAERATADLALFGEFVIACWDAFPQESHLLFSILAEQGVVVPQSELGRVLGPTLALLAIGSQGVQAAIDEGVIGPGPASASAMDRVVVTASALLGVLLTSHLSHLDPHAFDHRRLARTAWHDLLRGWGMDARSLRYAEGHLLTLAAAGPLAPPVADLLTTAPSGG